LVHVENPCVGDGRAKDIPRQISQHGIITMAVVLTEGDPLSLLDVQSASLAQTEFVAGSLYGTASYSVSPA
jgi:hypothetical protein